MCACLHRRAYTRETQSPLSQPLARQTSIDAPTAHAPTAHARFQMAFDTLQVQAGKNFAVVDYAIDFIFACDVVANFNTAFYSDDADAYVLDHGRIAQYYVSSGWLAVDVASCLPFDVIVADIVTSSSSGAATVQLVKVRWPAWISHSSYTQGRQPVPAPPRGPGALARLEMLSKPRISSQILSKTL